MTLPNLLPPPTRAGRSSASGSQAGFLLIEVLVASLIVVMVLLGAASAILSVHRLQRQSETLYLANNDLRTASAMISNEVHHAAAVATYDPTRTTSSCSEFGLSNVHLEPGLSIMKNATEDGVHYFMAADGSTGMAKLVRDSGGGPMDVFAGLDPDCSGFLLGDRVPGHSDYKNGAWVYLKFRTSPDRMLVRPLSFFLFPGG